MNLLVVISFSGKQIFILNDFSVISLESIRTLFNYIVTKYYILIFFHSMRSKDANQSLNEDMFHKLTGGWV